MTDFEGLADARAGHDRRLDVFDIDAHAVQPDATDDEQMPAGAATRIEAASAVADFGLRARPEAPRAKRYSLPNSAMYSRPGDSIVPAYVLLLNDRDLRTVVAEVRRPRIFPDGTLFLPLQLWLRTGERQDNTTLRVSCP